MAAGASWMILFKLVDRGLGLASTIVLARLLVPGDFGIVAMAASVIALLELFSAFGLDISLIQRAETTKEHFDSAWTLNVLAGLTVACLLIANAWPLAIFFREPRLAPVICALAAGSVIQGFENIGTVRFRKDLQFDREFRFLTAKRLLPFFVTLPLAFILRNYWALVIGTVVGRVGAVILSYAFHPFRPRFGLHGARDLMHFSKWMLLHNVIAFFKDRSSSFVVGRLSDAAGLGLFSLSAEIASLPSTELIAPINRALLPIYARLADDKPALGREYLQAMGAIALIAVPAVAGIALTAPYVVTLFLGPKWQGAVPLLQILAFFGITQVLQTNAFSAFIALGKPKAYVQINVIHVVVLLVLLITLTKPYGLIGAAWAYVVTALLLLPVNFALIIYYIGLRPVDLLARFWRPVVAAGAMYGLVRTLSPPVALESISTAGAGSALAICVATGIATYCLGIVLLWLIAGRPQGAETWILGRLRVIAERAEALVQRKRAS